MLRTILMLMMLERILLIVLKLEGDEVSIYFQDI